jgi:hypothetical protein
MSHRIVGWLLDRTDRTRLLDAIRPAYARIVADHVTRQFGAPTDVPMPIEHEGRVVGVADDGQGVQALVVEIGGTARRLDGSTFHNTWSLADGRKAVEGNHVIRAHGWVPLSPRLIRLEPGVLS